MQLGNVHTNAFPKRHARSDLVEGLGILAPHLFADEPVSEKVEYWRWRYQDLETGRTRPTMFQMLEEEARATYGDVERIEGSMTLREVPQGAFVAAGRASGEKRCLD